MKTLKNLKNTLLILLVSISITTVKAQKGESGSLIVYLDTVSVDNNHQSFEKMVSNITTTPNFKYRKSLRLAKAANNTYIFSDKEVSETEILKYFKKAARKSHSVEDFRKYFYDRELSLIDKLDGSTIYRLYTKIRSTTFNGYLDDLEGAFGSVY